MEIYVTSWVKWTSETCIARKQVCVIDKRSTVGRQLTFKLKTSPTRMSKWIYTTCAFCMV